MQGVAAMSSRYSSRVIAQVQQLVQQLAEVEAARDALEARLAALPDADALVVTDASSTAPGVSEGASTLQRVRTGCDRIHCVSDTLAPPAIGSPFTSLCVWHVVATDHPSPDHSRALREQDAELMQARLQRDQATARAERLQVLRSGLSESCVCYDVACSNFLKASS